MKNLNPGICRQFKAARREAGLSQSELASELGCKQSALSMFENGDGTKLNDDVIAKLAKRFGVDLAAPLPEMEKMVALPAVIYERHSGFCPNGRCPSHRRYEVEGRVLVSPNREAQDPVGGKYCAVCGELLERKCPNCGAAVHDGAICSWCGLTYLA